MSLNTNSNALADKLQSRDATREPTWVRYTLLTIALIFFLSCLILPLILVFVEAFKQGVGVYTQALVHPDTLSAVSLISVSDAFSASSLALGLVSTGINPYITYTLKNSENVIDEITEFLN